MIITDYEAHDGLGLAQLIQSGELSIQEVNEAMRSLLESRNPALNAIVDVYDREIDSLANTGHRFCGLPMFLKDLNVFYKGYKTANGSRFLQEDVAYQTSAVAQRYINAGLTIAGRTNSPEFGLSPTTEPELHGPTHNPWKPGLSSGGSSGGAAAAVAAGIVPFAHATDGGGSIRIPASACGVFGLKPSRGRVSPAPFFGTDADGLIAQHVVSRSVRDSAALLDIASGGEPGDRLIAPTPDTGFLAALEQPPPSLRIAFSTNNPYGFTVDKDCIAAVEEAAKICEEAGHHVEEKRFEYDAAELAYASYIVMATNIRASLDERADKWGVPLNEEQLEPLSAYVLNNFAASSSSDYVKALRAMQAIARKAEAFCAQYDLMLTPVLGLPPQAHGELIYKTGDDIEAYGIKMATYAPFTGLANATGQPSMSLPLYWSAENLPIGVAFTAAYGSEALMLRFAAQMERVKPWFDRRPYDITRK